MKLENQVCSLESAKKLKELGVKQDSLFYWFNDGNWIILDEDNIPSGLDNDGECMFVSEMYPAYTVAELGEMLPVYFYSDKTTFDLKLFPDRVWICGKTFIDYTGGIEFEPFAYGKTEVEARARMVIHLLENKTITVKEINLTR